MTTYEIVELTVPESADAPDAADFAATVEIMSIVENDGYGTTEMSQTVADVLPFFKDPSNPRRLFGVRVDGRIVARAVYDWIITDDEVAVERVDVLPDYRRRGIGTALADHLDNLVREDGRSRIITYAVSKTADGPRLDSPTGFGSVPRENPEVTFLLSRGFTLEQVERASRLALPLDGAGLRARVEAASARSGADYRLHHWVGATPQKWLEQIAMLYTRMSTDAPSAGLEQPEDVYTVERVVSNEANYAKARHMLTAVVEHVPTGKLAGYTTLAVPFERSRPVFQDDTLVLRDHRGHKLGMLLKVANLENLQNEFPGLPSVITWNAEENRFMLDVNEEVGFVPMGYEGAWKRLL